MHRYHFKPTFMKKIYTLIALSVVVFITAQAQTYINTIDIEHFWQAYDALPNCKTKADSIQSFQVNYIDKASDGFKAFLKVRDFTAEEYYRKTKQGPKFWNSVRANTLKVKSKIADIEQVYADYEKAFPNHKRPKICFAIGCLRTAGTVSGDYLLIGTEMIAADGNTDKSELNNWLKSVLTDEFDVVGIIAHEYVHALQKVKFGTIWAGINHRVLMQCLQEGAADFLAETITGKTINKSVYEYGDAHEAEIWEAFKKDMWGKNSSNWLYQGTKTKNGEPADLGYFVGYKICESYYNTAKNKQKALRDILVIKNYKRLYKKSGYAGR